MTKNLLTPATTSFTHNEQVKMLEHAWFSSIKVIADTMEVTPESLHTSYGVESIIIKPVIKKTETGEKYTGFKIDWHLSKTLETLDGFDPDPKSD